MVCFKKVLSRLSFGKLSRDILINRLKGHMLQYVGKNAFLTLYMTYTDLLKVILMKMVTYVTNSKVIAIILVTLL